jgi:3',5'-cyclic AMP phosphodiesterase CpdA
MPAAPALTVLHLSDMQFGRNHLFGRLNLPPPDAQFDNLFARLHDDLEALKRDHELTPDLLVVSGDLAEWGMPQEFKNAFAFLTQLVEYLQLPRQRVVIVPGNHDINRKACEAYFADCAADGREPVPPFSPKWKHFLSHFQEFYQGLPIAFTVEEPWSLFVMDELHVVVAGLNSTMAEIHNLPEDDPLVKTGKFGHFGWVGEAQLRWFAQKLKSFQAKGWLRLGVVHHNCRRGATDDNENLRDADDLDRLLCPYLNLLLHGHTHNGKLDRMPNGTPVLSTGSTALARKARPDEVPNQYQFIRVRAKQLELWTRRYDKEQKRWVSDTRCSPNGNRWYITHKVELEDVQIVFPKAVRRPRTRRSSSGSKGTGGSDPDDGERSEPADELGRDLRPRDTPRHDTFLMRVAQVCRLRHPQADIVPHTQPPGSVPYLRVTLPDDIWVRTYPVGVREHGLTSADVERFRQEVDARYRANDPRMLSELVYGGPCVDQALVQEARRQGIRLQSFVEYQGLLDFSHYLQRQTQRLQNDPVYPSSLYVPQEMKYDVPLPESKTDDALQTVTDWLTHEDGRFVLLLGDFGTGKTFLLRQLALRLAEQGPGYPVPVLIELRELQKVRTLNELIAQHFAGQQEAEISLPRFRYMLEKGLIALLFDAFDELVVRVTYDRATEHLDTLLEAALGKAKVVVTCRRQHFTPTIR